MLQNLLALSWVAVVQDPQAPPTGPAPVSPLSNPLFPLLLVAVLFFFLMFLPERKKQKQRQKMLEALKKGDRVMTSSGIYGTVVSTTPEIVVLQVADNVRLRFSRAAVQTVVESEKEPTAEEKPQTTKV